MLNHMGQGGCDFLDTADGSALVDFLGDYFDDPEHVEACVEAELADEGFSSISEGIIIIAILVIYNRNDKII